MKALTLITLSAIALASLSAQAQVKIAMAEYSSFGFWPGEYPPGYEVKKNMVVETVHSPTNPIPLAECTLPAKSVIHPWARKTKSEFISLSPIQHYQALVNFQVSEPDKIAVKKGDEILLLSYLAEGYCLYSHKGKNYEDSCFMQKDERAKLISASPFRSQLYFKTTCNEGRKAWVSLDVFQYSPSEEYQYAEVTDYGSVKEP